MMPRTRPPRSGHPDPFLTATAWIAGVVALLAFDDVRRRRVARNPFPRGSAEARAWLEGFRAKAEQAARVAVRGAYLVPRETPDETFLRHPGRGRARCGPRREWLDWEKRLAWTCQSALSRREIAALLPGRDAQAVKNQLHRMKLKQRTAIRDHPPSRSPLRRAKRGGSERKAS